MIYEIRHCWTNAVIRAGEFSTRRDAILAAVAAAANLRDADLTGANLAGADLRDANLTGADLTRAYLRAANLRGAHLTGAHLADANLRDANLTGADLTGAELAGADLTGAELAGADLAGANLAGANLRGAHLTGADLTGADLADAHLADANLRDANLAGTRDDLWRVLDAAPAEAEALLHALYAGAVDGWLYEGKCACLIGTIANARGCSFRDLPGLAPNSNRPAERWFLAIRPGLAPEHPVGALTIQWIEEWFATRKTVTVVK